MTALLTDRPGTLIPPPPGRAFRALVRRGLLDRRRAPLTWGGSLGASCALVVGIWPSIEGSISKAIQNYPEGLKQAFGITELNTAEAYLNAEMFSLVMPLAMAFFAVRVVAAAITVAEERGHLDTLLSAPISRRVLVASTMAVAAIASAVVLLVVAVMTWGVGAAVGAGLSLGPTLAGVASVWSLAMMFAGVAALAAGFLHRSASVTGVATGLLVAMYIIDVLGKVADGMEPFRAVSAFKYYGSALTDGLDVVAFLGLALVGVACAAVGALLFERRDVSAH